MRLSLLQRYIAFDGPIIAVLPESNDSVNSFVAHGFNVLSENWVEMKNGV